MAKRWSAEEDAILREIWTEPCLLKIVIDRLPGRTENTSIKRAAALGLGPKKHPEPAILQKTKRLLADGKIRNVRQIAEAVGASVCHTRRMVMRAVRAKELAVSRYLPTEQNGNYEAYFRLGAGLNATRPPYMTPAQRARKFRENVDPIEYAFKKKQYNLNRRIRLGKLPEDELTNAFFGRTSA